MGEAVTGVENFLRILGAERVDIVEERPDIRINTVGLTDERRLEALRVLQQHTLAGTKVIINNNVAASPETPESGTEAVAIENVSTLFGSSKTAQRTAQSDTDSVEQVKNAYVSGEIEHVYELEAQLNEPVKQQLESEGLLQ